jgi:hypothetical protein
MVIAFLQRTTSHPPSEDMVKPASALRLLYYRLCRASLHLASFSRISTKVASMNHFQVGMRCLLHVADKWRIAWMTLHDHTYFISRQMVQGGPAALVHSRVGASCAFLSDLCVIQPPRKTS